MPRQTRAVTIVSAAERKQLAMNRIKALLDPDNSADPKTLPERLRKACEPQPKQKDPQKDQLMLRIELTYLAAILSRPATKLGAPRYVELFLRSGSDGDRCLATTVSDPDLDGSVIDLSEKDRSKQRKFSIIKPLPTTVEATSRTKRKKVTGV